MESLPAELKRRIASFLSPDDALSFSLSNKTNRSGLSLSVLRPSLLIAPRLHWVGHFADGDTPRRGRKIPLLLASNSVVHSVKLKMEWCDQGWGHRKGRLYLVELDEGQGTDLPPAPTEDDGPMPRNIRAAFPAAPARAFQGVPARAFPMQILGGMGVPVHMVGPPPMPPNDNDSESETPAVPFDGGVVVYETPEDAPRTSAPLEITFVPRPGKWYQLWYKAGGGGGHTLQVDNLRWNAVVWDDPNYGRRRVYNFLAELGLLQPAFVPGSPRSPLGTFVISLLDKIARSKSIDGGLASFLVENGLEIDASSSAALGEFADILSRE